MINDNDIKGYYQLFFRNKPYGKKYPTRIQAVIEAFEKGLVSIGYADFLGDKDSGHALNSDFSIRFIEEQEN
jgi:hypothetical protein